MIAKLTWLMALLPIKPSTTRPGSQGQPVVGDLLPFNGLPPPPLPGFGNPAARPAEGVDVSRHLVMPERIERLEPDRPSQLLERARVLLGRPEATT